MASKVVYVIALPYLSWNHYYTNSTVRLHKKPTYTNYGKE